MILRSFFDDKLAQASYMVGCAVTGEAIVIDPLRDTRQYTDMAESLGLRIVSVTETHIHADYLSGTRELAAATGATMFLSDEGGPDWTYAFGNESNVVLMKNGHVIQVGNVTLTAMHTPGHTPEHMAYLLVDHPTSEIPHSLFSGDFIFVGDVGRPDLLEKAANIVGTMEAGAKQLYQSLKLVSDLPDSLLIWPGHGAGSACGKSLGGSPVTTLGYERKTNWALKAATEEMFVQEVLSGQPEPPKYFKNMKMMNRQGPAVLHSMPDVTHVSQPLGNLLDVRPAAQIRKQTYRDSIAIPMCKQFTTWAGWILSYDEPVTLIANSQEEANVAARELAMIGLDVVKGFVRPGDLLQENFGTFQVVTSDQVSEGDFILDVRGTAERRASSIKSSTHIPYWSLKDHLAELPRDQKVVVHCASGARSLVAYSILRQAGFQDIWELQGGISAVQKDSPQLIGSGV